MTGHATPVHDSRPWDAAWATAERIPHHDRVRLAELDGARYVLKIARPSTPLEHEATVARYAAEVRSGHRPIADRSLRADSAMLVTACDPTAESLHDRLLRQWEATPLAGVGRALAAMHRHREPTGLPDARPERPRFFPLTPALHAAMPIGTVQVLRALDEHAAERDLLESAASRTPRVRTLVHGDCKPDNIRVRRDDGSVRFIDWELGGAGDPLEDLAGAMGALIAVSVQDRLTTASPTAPSMAIGLSEGMNRGWECIAAMLSAYSEAGGEIADLDDLVLLTAVKVLCRAQVQAALMGKVGATAHVLLQATLAIARNRGRVADLLR